MPRVIEYAKDFGYTLPEADEACMVKVQHGDLNDERIEQIIFLADDALGFLNRRALRDPRISFGWHEGELYLWPMTWWRRKLAG
jgi:hypothetical protein